MLWNCFKQHYVKRCRNEESWNFDIIAIVDYCICAKWHIVLFKFCIGIKDVTLDYVIINLKLWIFNLNVKCKIPNIMTN